MTERCEAGEDKDKDKDKNKSKDKDKDKDKELRLRPTMLKIWVRGINWSGYERQMTMQSSILTTDPTIP